MLRLSEVSELMQIFHARMIMAYAK